MRWIGLPAAATAVALVVGAASAPRAQDAGQALNSLKGVRPPAPPAYDRLVKDKGWLTILGKAHS